MNRGFFFWRNDQTPSMTFSALNNGPSWDASIVMPTYCGVSMPKSIAHLAEAKAGSGSAGEDARTCPGLPAILSLLPSGFWTCGILAALICAGKIE